MQIFIPSPVAVVVIVVLVMRGGKEIESFRQGFRVLEGIDAKYGASFKTEQVNWSMVPLEKIDLLVVDIGGVEARVSPVDTPEVEALRRFILARKSMLQSQLDWQLGERIGPIGEVTDEAGFSCAEYPYIVNAAAFYNPKWINGLDAMRKLDLLLHDFRDVEGVKELVGIDDEKPLFYKSPFYQAADHFRSNVLSLEARCGFDFNLTEKDLKIIRFGDDKK